MRTLAKIYYIGQIVAALIFFIGFGFYAVRGIIQKEHIFVIVCFAIGSIVGYRLMVLPSIKEYKEFKNVNK